MMQSKHLFQGHHAFFSKTMLRHILQVLQQRGFVVKECEFWTDLPALQTSFTLKYVKEI